MVKTNAARRLFLSRTERSLILECKKTQVRMEVKLPHHNPLGYWEPGVWGGPNGGRTASGETVPEQVIMWHSRTGEILGCPYGQPGDRLWVPEAWRPDPSADHEAWRGHGSYVEWSGGGCPPSDLPSDLKKPEHCIYQTDSLGNDLAWLSPAKMPRWASRILLEIISVHVERLHDISEADAQDEGCALECMTLTGDDSGSAIYGPGGYQALWKSINGTGSWDANPWVWVVKFKRVDASFTTNA